MVRQKKKTIVFVTPLKVEADSRTFKQAASLARFGYLSVVVELERSDLNENAAPFELIAVKKNEDHAVDVSRNTKAAKKEAIQGLKKFCRNRLPRRLLEYLRIIFFIFDYLYHTCFMTFKSLPRASLYYLHAPYQFPAVYLASKRYRVPYIYDAHDFYVDLPDYESAAISERFACRVYRYVEFLCIKKASAVVTVNDGIAALIREEFDYRSGILVIRNCHDYRLDQRPEREIREKLGLGEEVFLLIVVGNAKKGQAVKAALDLMAMLPPNAHLAFLGKGYETYLDDVFDKALSERIHFIRPVKPYEVVPFIRAANATLILYYPKSENYKNCLPNGFFQSMAAGLPLLYPELPEIKKIAESYELGLAINPQSADSIRKAVETLMEDKRLYLKFKRNLKRAGRELSWEREEEKLLKLIVKSPNMSGESWPT